MARSRSPTRVAGVGGLQQARDVVDRERMRQRTRQLRLDSDAAGRTRLPLRERNRWNDRTDESARATERALYGRSSSPHVDAEIDATNDRMVDSSTSSGVTTSRFRQNST